MKAACLFFNFALENKNARRGTPDDAAFKPRVGLACNAPAPFTLQRCAILPGHSPRAFPRNSLPGAQFVFIQFNVQSSRLFSHTDIELCTGGSSTVPLHFCLFP